MKPIREGAHAKSLYAQLSTANKEIKYWEKRAVKVEKMLEELRIRRAEILARLED